MLISVTIYSDGFLEDWYVIPFFGFMSLCVGSIPALLVALCSLIIRNRLNYSIFKFISIATVID